ncbi:MAG TPA: hypothetical protein VMV07_21270 [Streptosporangiaceae bacterium]|nr:hypothetical protein [Streptosporangiaceae bacterium]
MIVGLADDLGRERAPSLPRMCETWVWMVLRDRNIAAAMSGLDSPAPTSPATVSSVGVRDSQPAVGTDR